MGLNGRSSADEEAHVEQPHQGQPRAAGRQARPWRDRRYGSRSARRDEQSPSSGSRANARGVSPPPVRREEREPDSSERSPGGRPGRTRRAPRPGSRAGTRTCPAGSARATTRRGRTTRRAAPARRREPPSTSGARQDAGRGDREDDALRPRRPPCASTAGGPVRAATAAASRRRRTRTGPAPMASTQARGPGDVHAEHEDEERVDLHVEARAERGRRPACAGPPSRRRRPAPAPRAPGRPAATPHRPVSESTVSAATPPTSVARARVTQSAGPSRSAPAAGQLPGASSCRRRHAAGDTDQPSRPSPGRRCRGERRRAAPAGPTSPITGPFEPCALVPPYLWVRGNTRKCGGPVHRRGLGGRLRWRSEALAFWLREPGVGEIRPARCRARARRRARPHAALRDQPGHRVAGLPRRGAVQPVRRDARAVPGGRLPGAGEVRLPQRRRGRAGPADAARAHGVLPLPAPDRLRRAGRRGDRSSPTTCRRSGRCSPGTVETAVNALWDAAPLVGDRVTVVGAGMVGCCVARLLARLPGRRRSPSSTSTRTGPRSPPRWASSSPRPRTPPAAGTWSCTPARPSAGLQLSLDLLAPEGTVIELSWYGDREVQLSARRRVPLRPAGDPGQPGRPVSPARRGRRTHGRPPCAGARPAAGPRLRRAADRRVAASTSCPTSWRGLPTAPARRSATPIRYGEGVADVQRDRPRPHDDRAQLPRRGVRSGAAAAWRDVRGGRDVPRGPTLDADSIVVDIGRATEQLQAVLGRADLPQPRRRARVRAASTPPPRRSPGWSPIGWPTRVQAGALGDGARDLTGIVVTLHESHVAWASYERAL